MKIAITIIRLGLGIFLLFFGLNKFFWFLPDFDFKDDIAAENLYQAFTNSGYMWPLVGSLELVVGILFVFKKWMAFAIVILVPLSVNVVLFHAVLNPANIGAALVVAILNGYFMYRYWGEYRLLFS